MPLIDDYMFMAFSSTEIVSRLVEDARHASMAGRYAEALDLLEDANVRKAMAGLHLDDALRMLRKMRHGDPNESARGGSEPCEDWLAMSSGGKI